MRGTIVVVFALALPLRALADLPPRVSAADALKTLLAGNQAFVAGGGSCPRQTAAHRSEVATAQHPLAIVIGCADSRVPPESIFNQGVGDLFVIRVAGNVIDDVVLGTHVIAIIKRSSRPSLSTRAARATR